MMITILNVMPYITLVLGSLSDINRVLNVFYISPFYYIQRGNKAWR